MNTLAAMKETIELAIHSNSINHWAFYHPSLGLEHIIDMWRRVREEEMSDDKLSRWLGWMQAAVITWGDCTVEQMKEINRRNA